MSYIYLRFVDFYAYFLGTEALREKTLGAQFINLPKFLQDNKHLKKQSITKTSLVDKKL